VSNHTTTSRITIGSFDGLHIGHQTIIHQLVSDAHSRNQQAVVVTFSPNPVVFFKHIQSPFYLTSDEEKRALLQEMGVDETIILPFDQQLASTSAEDFIADLHKKLHFDTIYIGYDFRFGSNREGDAQKIQELGEKFQFTVIIQDPILQADSPISSSLIRKKIENGEVKAVYPLLDRWYSLTGEVVHGDGRGKKIGIPTANIAAAPQKLLPRDGIYAARIRIHEDVRPTAVSIGVRPTFYNDLVPRTIEAYILDWDRDIYQQTVTLEFIQRLRDELKYEDARSLTAQIEKDIRLTREIVNNGY